MYNRIWMSAPYADERQYKVTPPLSSHPAAQRRNAMKYDFTSIIDRTGKDAIAVDLILFPDASVQEGFSKFPCGLPT